MKALAITIVFLVLMDFSVCRIPTQSIFRLFILIHNIQLQLQKSLVKNLIHSAMKLYYFVIIILHKAGCGADCMKTLAKVFGADSGFIPRVDTRRINGFLQRRFFGDGSKWYTQLNFGFTGERIENHEGLLTDSKLQGFANFSGPLQSFLQVDVYRNKEFFDGVTYDINRVESIFQMKPSGKIALNFFGQVGDAMILQIRKLQIVFF